MYLQVLVVVTTIHNSTMYIVGYFFIYIFGSCFFCICIVVFLFSHPDCAIYCK